MADSNITKRALAAALKELMEEMPFDKINIAQICEKCGMHRKSFYYHFKDKYDLVNWIFDTEIIGVIQSYSSDFALVNYFSFVQEFTSYLHKNKSFYRKAFLISGQNSFSEHFREYIYPLIKTVLQDQIHINNVDAFEIDFFADATINSIERWILGKYALTPEQFVAKEKTMFYNIFLVLNQLYSTSEMPQEKSVPRNE